MKIILTLILLIGAIASAPAQGTIQFIVQASGADVVPPNANPVGASGQLSLSGLDLSYSLGIYEPVGGLPIPIDATINGPANAGSSAPVLFDLGGPTTAAVGQGVGFSWKGTINNLTTAQIGDLVEGLWYVNVLTHTDTGTPADSEIRGQITPVPEPSALTLLSLATACLGLSPRRKRR